MAKLSIEQVGSSTYYIPGATNCGIYAENGRAVLIDSGNDKEAGRQINKLIRAQGWELASIISTHSNADHIGGNAFLKNKTGCTAAATSKEACFIEHPDLEPALLYGGFPHPGIRNKFLLAKPSLVDMIIPFNEQFEPVPIAGTPLTAIPLPGHFLQMIGIRTPDNVFFLADSLFSRQIIKKYHFFYLYDIQAQFRTLDYLESLAEENAGTASGETLFIPSHAEPLRDIRDLVLINRNNICDILETIQSYINEHNDHILFSQLMNHVCDHYAITLDANQYVLVSSCLRSYISYLMLTSTISVEYTQGFMKITRNYD